MTVSHAQTPPRTVDDYLRQLRRALEGASPALIQDALADAEDYMREEVGLDSFKPESEIIARVVRVFGFPAEVAEEYRAVEGRYQKRMGMSSAKPRKGFFAVAVDPRSYGALLYALLSLPLGVFYFVWVVTGASLSIGLAIFIIGVPLALLFLFSVNALAWIEGRIVELLLGKRMPRRLPLEERPPAGVWPRLRAVLTRRRTWSAMLYMLLQLPVGVCYFTIAVTGLALSLSLVAGPVVESLTGKDVLRFPSEELNQFSHTPLGVGVAMALGVLLFFVLLHALRAIAALHANYAEKALVHA